MLHYSIKDCYLKQHFNKLCSIVWLLALCFCGYAEPPSASFLKKYNNARTGREKGEAVINYLGNNNDSLKEKALTLLSYFEDKEDNIGGDYTRLIINMLENNTGDFANSLKESFDALQRFENNKDAYGRMWALAAIANAYAVSKNYNKAIFYYKEQSAASMLVKDSVRYINAINNIAYTYALAKIPDSGIVYAERAVNLSHSYGYKDFLPYSMSTLGENYMAKNEYKKALPILRESYAGLKNDAFGTAGVINDLILCFAALNNKDSMLYYAHLAINVSKTNAFNSELLKTYESMYRFFDKTNNIDSSNKYFRLATAVKDSLYNIEKIKLVENVSFKQQLQRQEQLQQQQNIRSKVKLYSLLAAFAVMLIIATILFRNNRNEQKANKLLQSQKQEIEQQRDRINEALSELKLTQAQLIQSEKMASLGELTAGIAHEIQNRLNFVNNFSEVNTELINELIDEADKKNYDEVKIIATDIKANEEKINHHGKRADSIVKGMLQHSRQTSGKKEPTDINALCDEYLRLAYHGMRAKDKSFNAITMNTGIETDFDESIGEISVVPQDIGRVLLNLFNNAFYAVNEKSQQSAIKSPQSLSYKPIVSLSTKKIKPTNSNALKNTSLEKDAIEIIVRDNGNGIPQNIIDKIFQPFFTTKPTGSGTGLGLSLSYDIIKAHGGEIKVKSKEGEGSEFIIQLPMYN